MLSFLKKLADVSDPNSISNRFRKKRFANFLDLIKDIPKPVKILDAGGTFLFWQQMGCINEDVHVTILNNDPENVPLHNFKTVTGDVVSMKQFSDKEFDVVFSNSVIEHLNTYESQKKMADEIIRTGKNYFVQTPSRLFPIEPHFLFPFFQFLPIGIRIFMLMHFNLGWYTKQECFDEALELAKSIRMMNLNEIKTLFPASSIKKEKYLFLTKSYIVHSR